MAIVANMTLSQSSISSGEEVEVLLVIENQSTTEDVEIVEVRPTTQGLQRVVGVWNGVKVLIPAGSSLTCKYSIYAYIDNQSVLAQIFTSDGQMVDAYSSIIVN